MTPSLSTIKVHLNKNKVPFKYKKYTKEEVLQIAKSYTTILEFLQKNRNVYEKSKKLGILQKLKKDNHFRQLGNLKNKFVYVYFLTNNRVYVGQTCDLERRHKEHKNILFKENEIIKKVVSKLLAVNRATKLEEYLRLRYIKLKFNVLNKTTCHSTGGHYLKWTKEK